MRVYINGRFLAQRVTGVQRFAMETLRALDKELAAAEWVGLQFCVLAPPGALRPRLLHIDYKNVGHLSGHAWEQLDLPYHARNGLLVGLASTGPLLHRKQIVTMHDAAVFAVPEAFSLQFRQAYRGLMRVLSRLGPLTMTVSEFSRQELARYLRVSPDCFVVTGEGHEHALSTAADHSILDRHGLSDGGYVLAVGSTSVHKNFQLLAKAVASMPDCVLPVVVAGGSDARIFGSGATLDSFVRVGYVSDAELRGLYEHAAAFVFPSRYEGFGLPPLEAMAVGCPVICSSAASMPEVCGDAALYFDPDDAQGLADHMRLLFGSPQARADLRDKAQAVLARHRWQSTARAYLNAIQSIAVRG